LLWHPFVSRASSLRRSIVLMGNVLLGRVAVDRQAALTLAISFLATNRDQVSGMKFRISHS
jgi:hypothetical protein